MGITVGEIYAHFPHFRQQDIENLVGSKNFNGRTTISLNRIASYNGQYAEDLGIFVAKKEKTSYTKLLPEKQQIKLNEQIGIVGNDTNKNIPSYIPMGKSIFNYNKPEFA